MRCGMWVLCCVCVQVSSPFEVAEFDIIFGEGINALGSVVDTAKEMGVLDARVSDSQAGRACPEGMTRVVSSQQLRLLVRLQGFGGASRILKCSDQRARRQPLHHSSV